MTLSVVGKKDGFNGKLSRSNYILGRLKWQMNSEFSMATLLLMYLFGFAGLVSLYCIDFPGYA